MKLFTTISSERGKPVTKSGNEFIECLYNTTSRDKPTHRVRLIDDSRLMDCIYFSVEVYEGNRWVQKYNEIISTI